MATEEWRHRWREVGDGVFVRPHRFFDMNVGAVLGPEGVLLVDTRTSHRQGVQLLEAVSELTSVQVAAVVNTHAHFDHCFGNWTFRPAPIWGHQRCALSLREHGERQRQAMIEAMPPLAEELGEVEIVPPERTFEVSADLDVGGRAVELRHLGRGHTDADIVVRVPDADVVFAGDLVEEGGPPGYHDAYPLDWPHTVAALALLISGPVVPGHGDVVDAAYVQRQHDDLASVAAIARVLHAQGGGIEDGTPHLPLPAEMGRVALDRAAMQLRGEL